MKEGITMHWWRQSPVALLSHLKLLCQQRTMIMHPIRHQVVYSGVRWCMVVHGGVQWFMPMCLQNDDISLGSGTSTAAKANVDDKDSGVWWCIVVYGGVSLC